MYVLKSQIPIAKKTWRFFTVATDIQKEDAIDIGKNKMGDVIQKMAEWRANHVRSFRHYPKYLKFFVMENFNPRFRRSRKVMEFNIWLDSGEVEIVG